MSWGGKVLGVVFAVVLFVSVYATAACFTGALIKGAWWLCNMATYSGYPLPWGVAIFAGWVLNTLCFKVKGEK